MKTFRRQLLILFASVVGILGLVYGSVRVFTSPPYKISAFQKIFGTQDLGPLTIFLLGVILLLLAGAIGDYLAPLSHQMKTLLGHAHLPTVLEGEKSIYEEATRLVGKADRNVLAATFRKHHAVDIPPYWPELAQRARLQALDFILIYGYGDAQNVREADAAHNRFFADLGLPNLCDRRFFPSPVGVDMLIVDERSLLLALPVIRNDTTVRRAILLTEPKLVKDVASWFRHHLEPSSLQTLP